MSVAEQESLLNDFGDSLVGNFVNVPSPMVSLIEKLSKSCVFDTAAIAAIAVAGIGGKIFYDKKQDDEDDDDEKLDEDVLSLNKKSGSSVNLEFISGSAVALKHGLLETGEVVI